MIYIGIDPGFSGAWGIVDHHGRYVSCGDMHNDGYRIQTRMVTAELRQGIDMQDCMVVVEQVHAMPKQGVSSTFKFGVAYGAALAIADRVTQSVILVTPAVWKRKMGLTGDKADSLEMARELWPTAPLQRQKDNGRAEALLLAEFLRKETT